MIKYFDYITKTVIRATIYKLFYHMTIKKALMLFVIASLIFISIKEGWIFILWGHFS